MGDSQELAFHAKRNHQELMTFLYSCPCCDHELEYEFVPGELVKFCLDHDNPEFSNPGSSDEIDGPERCDQCGEVVCMENVIETALEEWSEQCVPDPDRDRE